jgi:hypothetical protein
MGRLSRFIIEYLGNVEPIEDVEPDEPNEPLQPVADRRTNHRNRELVEWVKGQMEVRGFPPSRKHEFVDDLRRALRQADGESEKEYSRDAPA